MGLVAFSLMLVVAAFQTRDERASILTFDTFDNRTVNLTALVEIALAALIASGGAVTNVLNTQHLTATQWIFGAVPAAALLVLWELGKLVARRRAEAAAPAVHTAPIAA